MTAAIETVIPGLDAPHTSPPSSHPDSDYAGFLADILRATAASFPPADCDAKQHSHVPRPGPQPRDPAADARAALKLLRETSWIKHRLVIDPDTVWQAERAGGGYVYLSAPAHDFTGKLLGVTGPWMPAPAGFCLTGALWHVQGRPILPARVTFLDVLGAPLQAVENVIQAEWPETVKNNAPGSIAMHWNDQMWTAWPDVERVLEKAAAC